MNKAVRDPEQNEIKALLQFADFADRRVLEVGCGEGRLTWRYARHPASVIGIDVDRNALRVATIDRPSDLADRIHFANVTSEQLPFRKDTFDMAIFAWSF